jgi:hypothetical protein
MPLGISVHYDLSAISVGGKDAWYDGMMAHPNAGKKANKRVAASTDI